MRLAVGRAALGESQDVWSQSGNGLIVGEIHLTTQMAEEAGALESVHDRAFDLAEVKPDACLAKPLVDCLEALECAGVDVVDG